MGLYTGTSSGGGLYSGGASSGSTKKHHGSFLDHLGPVGNLVKDAEGAVVGLPSGLELLATHPIRTAQDVAHSYAQTYGPLFHGDLAAFARGVYQHPLNPLLDVLSVATLGAGGAARAGGALGRAGLIEEGSRLARLGDRTTLLYRSPAALADELGAPVETKLTSHNPLIRARQTLVHELLNRADYNAPVVGELARYTRMAKREPHAAAQLRKQDMNAHIEAFSKLSKRERTAVGLLERVPLPAHLDAMKEIWGQEAVRGNAEAEQLLKDASDAKVLELYANPSKRMLAAHAESSKLGELDAKLKIDYGVLTPQEAELARFRHSRIAGGATVYDAQSARAAVKRIDGQLRGLRKSGVQISKAAARLRAKGTPELAAARRQAGETAAASARKTRTSGRVQAALERIDRLHQELAGTSDQLEQLAAGKQLSSQQLLDAGLKPGSNLEAFRHRLVGRLYDRATRLAEQYDRSLVAAAREARVDERLPSHSELGAHRAADLEQIKQLRSDVAQRLHAGRGELERIGKLESQLVDERQSILPGIVGGPSVEEIRAQLQAAGRPEPLYLPDVPATVKKTGAKGGGAFSYGSPVHHSEGLLFVTGRLALNPDVLGPQFLRTVVFAHYRDLHEMLLNSAVKVPKGGKLADGWVYVKRPVGTPELPNISDLTSTDAGAALIDHGARYAVPARLARSVEAELGRSRGVVAKIFDKPTQVWRALVLNLRVGWLTNNVVGNHLLYALRYAGPTGLKGYLDALTASKGGEIARRLLDLPETKSSLTKQDIAELLPEQAAGTFIGTQAPGRVEIPLGRGRTVDVGAGRAVRTAGLGLAKADKAVESQLRRAAVNVELRRNPAVKARMKAMDKETRSFREAARQELKSNPQLVREVSDQVNSALGDFLAMSPFAQQYLRGIFPFLAWYKAITKIVAKLPLDYPGRVDILAKLDQVGLAHSDEQLGPLPSFLRGAIPLGGDELLKTGGVNPLATVPQLARAAAVPFVPGARTNALAGVMNPFVQGAGGLLFGKQATSNGLAADLLQGIITDLPQATLIRDALNGPAPSKLYQPSALDDLLAFLGAPTKTINRREAAARAAQGR